MEKITNVKALEFVLANCNLPTDVAEKVEKMKAQFEKKNSAEKKPQHSRPQTSVLQMQFSKLLRVANSTPSPRL